MRRRARQLQQLQDTVVEALATLDDLRNDLRNHYLPRIKHYIRLLAEHLTAQRVFANELIPGAIDLSSKLALLHGIGEVAVPDRVLLDPRQPDAADIIPLQGYTRVGRDVLASAGWRFGQPSGFLRLAQQAAYNYHGRQDGRGFLENLAGEWIPPAARIIVLADRYDELASRHAYRPPLAHVEAVLLTQAGTGSEFDPRPVEVSVAVVDVFAEVVQYYADSVKALGMEIQQLEQAVTGSVELIAPPAQYADRCAVRRKAGVFGCARYGVCRITSDPLPFTLTPRDHVAPMKTPRHLEPLIEDGPIDGVVRPLVSGKEASVCVVCCDDSLHCAKVYKEVNRRNFRQATEYQEGRGVRNSHQVRAMAEGSKYGCRKQEEAWQNAEMATLFRLAGVGVRASKPCDFLNGVLLMELVTDADGDAASRSNDATLESDETRCYHVFLIRQIVTILYAGLVHGNLPEFNILFGPGGPVIIDLPQAVDAAGNSHVLSILKRDVDNMAAYFGRFAPELRRTRYAKEIQALYETDELTVETPLNGILVEAEEAADIRTVLRGIEAAQREKACRQALRQADDAPRGEREEPLPPWLQ